MMTAMLIEFLGSPCSGKTNTAARVFEQMKTNGSPVEFIPELARQYIVEHRVYKRLPAKTGLRLSEDQHLEIMRRQLQREALYRKGCTSTTMVITDGSPYNSLAYLKDRGSEDLQTLLTESLKLRPLIFWCRAVRPSVTDDSNRIHSFEESRYLDSDVLPGIVEDLRKRGLTVIELQGERERRFRKVMWDILDYMGAGGC